MKIFAAILMLGFLFVTFMWLSSYTHYTSIGIDTDTQKNNQITHRYYRLRWPGNGSIWLGGGISQRVSDPARPYDPFDWAATFLYSTPEKLPTYSMLNRLGFWYKRSDSLSNQQFWVGVPSIIPVFLLVLALLVIKKKD